MTTIPAPDHTAGRLTPSDRRRMLDAGLSYGYRIAGTRWSADCVGAARRVIANSVGCALDDFRDIECAWVDVCEAVAQVRATVLHAEGGGSFGATVTLDGETYSLGTVTSYSTARARLCRVLDVLADRWGQSYGQDMADEIAGIAEDVNLSGHGEIPSPFGTLTVAVAS